MSVTSDELFSMVNIAAWRIKGLDEGSRLHVLRQILSEKLSSANSSQRKKILFELLEKFELTAPSEDLLANPVPGNAVTNGEIRENRSPAVAKAEANIFDVVPPQTPTAKMPRVSPKSEALDREELHKAFNESVERMLNALNPEYLRSYVKKRTMQSDKAYKSELFDSYEEKFVQLVAYHEKGRLFKDFWALFRENLKK